MLKRFAAIVFSLALAGPAAVAQQDSPTRPLNLQDSSRITAQESTVAPSSTGAAISAEEATAMFRSAKHSLSESVGVAERKCGGKAIAARCSMKSRDEITSGYSRGANRNEPNRAGQVREIADESRTTTAGERGPVCVVTCLVGDNRLVDVVVCSKSNQVLAEEQIDSIAASSAAPRIAAASDSGSASNDPRFQRLPVQPNAAPHPPQTPGVHNASGSVSAGAIEQRDGNDAREIPVDRTRQTTVDRGFSMAGRTQKASDLIGKTVRNSDNEDLGKLENIVIDPQSGRAIYGVLSFGGFLGMGDKLFAIPWNSIQLPGDAKHVVLNIEKDRLKKAEGFDKDHWPNMADTRWATETHRYYGAEPYWQSGDTSASTTGGQDRRNDRSGWNAPSQSWQKCSDLIGEDVRTQAQEDVGELREIVIDPDSGRAIYGILDYRGKRFAIPWESFSVSADSKKLVLSCDKTKLVDSVSFNDNNWPDMTNRSWATDIHRHYGISPYWPTGDEVSRRP